MANKHIVRERNVAGGESNKEVDRSYRGQVVSEIMGDITSWRKERDNDFEALWDEYYAKWRGFWSPDHKSYKTERSKLISPLTAMAIDLTTSEIIEAVFGREYFIDMPDDIQDQDKIDMEVTRALLCQDLKDADFINEFSQAVLNGCLYGTGIMKVQVLSKVEKFPYKKQDGTIVAATREKIVIRPVAIEPGAFVGDPGCPNIDEMKGCAHEFALPLHLVRERQAQGVYYADTVVMPWGKYVSAPNRGDIPEGNRRNQGDIAFITEYYGLIPTRMYLRAVAEGKGVEVAEEIIEGTPEDAMTEVIATIANEGSLLRIIETPLITGERLMFAYQHETVPNRFYGRGVAEKASNVQRAMDAEMRSRIDGLAWSTPMFAGDLTRLPPGSNKSAWPGKFWGVRGNPNEVLTEFRVSGPDPNSFQHMQDLERMGQQATGALDTPSLRSGIRDETATGSALAASGFIKRAKRTMFNIEGFLNKLVRRVAHMKMQYEPNRYPKDFEFQVRGTIGIMAREIESQFMVDLARVLGPEHPASSPIVKAIFAHSGSPVRMEVLQSLQQLEEQSKPSKEEQALQQQAKIAAMRVPILQVQELEAKIAKLMSEAELKEAQAVKAEAEAGNVEASQVVDEVRVLNDLQETRNQQRQLDILEDKNEIEREKLAKQGAAKK